MAELFGNIIYRSDLSAKRLLGGAAAIPFAVHAQQA